MRDSKIRANNVALIPQKFVITLIIIAMDLPTKIYINLAEQHAAKDMRFVLAGVGYHAQHLP